MKIKKLLKAYKRKIKKDFLTEADKGLVMTYLEAFVKDIKEEA